MSKSKLQEICQAKGWKLPVYKTLKMSGKAHCPRFKSWVTVNMCEISSSTHKTKKSAENDAARIALTYTSNSLNKSQKDLISNNNKQPLVSNAKVTIFFDIENLIGDFKTLVNDHYLGNNIQVIGFISNKHHMIDKILKMCDGIPESKIKIVTLNLMMDNAVDYHIGIYLGIYMNENKLRKDIRTVLVTSDKFGQLIENITNKDDSLHKVDFISSLNELKSKFKLEFQ